MGSLRTVWLAMLLTLVAWHGAAADPPGPAPADSAAADAAESGPRQAPLEITDHAGLTDLLESKRGKIVVLDAWASWCEPCIKEFSGLVALHKQHDSDKVACISLCLDYDGTGRPEELKADVQEFLQEHGATFDNLLASEVADAMFKHLGIKSIPAVFVYNTEGVLERRFDDTKGPFSYKDVEQLVARLVSELPEKPSAETPTEPVAGTAPAAGDVDQLSAALTDKDPLARWKAARALRDLGINAAQATEALLEALTNDDDTDVRAMAAEALGAVGAADPQVLPALISALSSRDWEVRWSAVKTLGRMGKDAEKALKAVTKLRSDPDKSVREEARRAVKRIGG